jgi:hypothetical protein
LDDYAAFFVLSIGDALASATTIMRGLLLVL